MSRRRLFLLIVSATLFWLCRHAYYVGFFNDDAFYLLSAEDLLHGRSIELNYMPGWPLILSPVMVFASHPAFLQAYAIFLVLAGLSLLAFVVEKEDGPETADWVLACAALSPLTSSLSGTLLSDGPFFFLAALSLALFSLRGRAVALLVIILVVAGLTRPTGICLALAIAATLAFARRRREALWVSLPPLMALAAWLLSARLTTGQAWNYSRELVDSASAAGLPILSNAGFAARAIFERSLWRWPWAWGSFMSWGVALAGLVLGLCGSRGLREPSSRAAMLFGLFFLIPHLLWGKQAARYFLPLIMLASWLTLRGFKNRWGIRAAAVLSLALSAIPTSRVLAASLKPATFLNVPPLAAARWLRAHAPGATVAAEYDGRWRWLTALAAVHLPYDIRDAQDLAHFLRRERVDYVVVEETSFGLQPLGGVYRPMSAQALSARLRAVPGDGLVFEDVASRVQIWRFSHERDHADFSLIK